MSCGFQLIIFWWTNPTFAVLASILEMSLSAVRPSVRPSIPKSLTKSCFPNWPIISSVFGQTGGRAAKENPSFHSQLFDNFEV